MIRAYLSESLKLRRPSVAVGGLMVAALGVLATVLTFALAETAPAGAHGGPGRPALVLERLADADGLVRGFSTGMGLAGLLVFLVFTVTTTSEYGQGTLRGLLVQQPRRVAWLAGRLLALLSVVAAALLIALAASVLAALAMSRVRGLDTTAWWTSDGLTSAAAGYLNALLAAAFFGVAGTALGVLVRSTPVALAAGIAWMGPLEHLVQKASGTATRVLPGLLFDAVARGGVPDVGYSQALLTATAYAGIALLVAFASFARRDVTT